MCGHVYFFKREYEERGKEKEWGWREREGERGWIWSQFGKISEIGLQKFSILFSVVIIDLCHTYKLLNVRKCFGGAGEIPDLAGMELTVQQSELRFLAPTEKADLAARICRPSTKTWRQKAPESSFAGQPIQLMSFRFSERSCIKNKVENDPGRHSDWPRCLLAHICTLMHVNPSLDMYIHEHVYT